MKKYFRVVASSLIGLVIVLFMYPVTSMAWYIAVH
jgi:hypothetical protein